MQIISSTTSEWHHHPVTNRGWEQNYRCFSFRFDVTYDLWLLALVSWTDFQCCTLSTFTQRQWLPTQHRHSHNKSCDALQQPTCSLFLNPRLLPVELSLSLPLHRTVRPVPTRTVEAVELSMIWQVELIRVRQR
ncbi:hypothetical protein FOTG_03972 [Fusarium oxysporum f. sp. vasinfectum 25433]|uniref:Uncharacterized protein n=1 Tax=Fusarium oxysporum f. sp. vasinfectum 25433 TaxID=1089449 RepID=X0LYQ6_FUSOX|nr:hypothetical protein FOTG_03972 [Fusarium oxysporum f. sp. vasinfectum 25433]